jgi:hypothetical protein
MMPFSLRSALIGLAIAILLTGCQSGQDVSKPPVRVSGEAKKIIQESLVALTSPVTLHLYRGGENERQGEEMQVLIDFMAETSPNVIVVNTEFSESSKVDLEVDSGPVVEIKGRAKGIMRYYGFPERKEVAPFIDSILVASGGPVKLSPDVRSFLTGLEQEVVVRIFTTPD